MKTILTQKGSRLNVTVSGLDVYIEGSDGIQYEVNRFDYDEGLLVFKDNTAIILTDLGSKQVIQESLQEAHNRAVILLRRL